MTITKTGRALALAAGAALLLASCSSASGTTAPSPSASQSGSASGSGSSGGGGAGGGRNAPARQPGVNGEIAAASAGLLQVQSTSEQTAVHYSDSTTITARVKADASAITVGSCVMAMSQNAVATSVQVSPAVNGACTSGRTRPAGGSGGTGSNGTGSTGGSNGTNSNKNGSGSNGTGSNGTGSNGSGSNGSGGGSGSARPTFGLVSAVAGETVTLTENGTTSTVTLGSGTTVTTQQAATAADLTVGRCVSAQGSTDSSGAMTATSLRVSDPVDGTCSTGFGGHGGGRGGTGSGGGSNGGGSGSTGGSSGTSNG